MSVRPEAITEKLSLPTLALIVATCGCSNDGLYTVEGTVTVAGQPLETGRIEFIPAEGRRSLGRIRSDGTYELTTFDPGDGAKPGDYTVVVQAMEYQAQGEAPKSLLDETAGNSNRPVKSRSLIDPKYNQKSTTPLTATVERTTNRIDFDLE